MREMVRASHECPDDLSSKLSQTTALTHDNCAFVANSQVGQVDNFQQLAIF